MKKLLLVAAVGVAGLMSANQPFISANDFNVIDAGERKSAGVESVVKEFQDSTLTEKFFVTQAAFAGCFPVEMQSDCLYISGTWCGSMEDLVDVINKFLATECP